MQISLTREDAQLIRDLLEQRIVELDKEINRTDSLSFKADLRRIDAGLDRVLHELTAALARPIER